MPRSVQYSQSALQNAVEAVQKGTSIRQAASDWGIPRSTLIGRLNGRRSNHSRFILDPVEQSTNQSSSDPPLDPPLESPNSPSSVYSIEMDVPNSVTTPRRSTESLRQARSLFIIDFDEPIKRLLFEQVGGRIDISAFQLASVEAERDNLKQLVARLRPVMTTRAKWSKKLDPQSTSSEVQLAGFEALCSEWQLG
jgi:hypothetical protein